MTGMRRGIGRFVGIGALFGGGLLAGTATPTVAGAAVGSVTYHLYVVYEAALYVEANGQLVPENASPDPGGYFYYVGNAYIGSKKSHAAKATAAVDLLCILGATSVEGVCDGSIAVGGILMAANHVAVALSATGIGPLEITDATGKYTDDDGLATITPVSTSAANVTVTLHPEAYLGIDLAASDANGASVETVPSGGSAQKAGLAAGDVITSVGGQAVDTVTSFYAALNKYSPGDKVTVDWTTSSGQQMSGAVVAVGEHK
jgi:PDZ domain